MSIYYCKWVLLWRLTYHKMPADYNDVVRFARFVINTRLKMTNHKNSQMKGMNKWKKCLLFHIVTWFGRKRIPWGLLEASWTLHRIDLAPFTIIVNEYYFRDWHTKSKMPGDYNDVVRFAQFVINTWLRTTNHENSQMKGMNKWKTCLLFHIVTWFGRKRIPRGLLEASWTLYRIDLAPFTMSIYYCKWVLFSRLTYHKEDARWL